MPAPAGPHIESFEASRNTLPIGGGSVAVAGFNDLNGSDQMLPPLTTVRTPRSAIGTAAARMLLARMRGAAVAQTNVDLGFELLVRDST